MSILLLSIKNILIRPLNAFLSICLLSFGISIVLLVLLGKIYLKQQISKNLDNVDLVVGAKGSPLQIILSNVFHIDYPTGNVPLLALEKLKKNRFIKKAVPLSLGDNYEGYRIVGTIPEYLNLFGTKLSEGKIFEKEFEATVGAKVAETLHLKLGDRILSTHGLENQGVDHENKVPITVTGILASTDKVIDNLILVSSRTVWETHSGQHDKHSNTVTGEQKKIFGIQLTENELKTQEITALLISYKSPMAAIRLPMYVNSIDNLQAASPAFELARLFTIIEQGVQWINLLGFVIVGLSVISVFVSLLNSLEERKYEIAVMRSMGVSKFYVFNMIILEGLFLTIVGGFLGFLLVHTGFFFLNSSLIFVPEELYVVLGCILLGCLTSLIPAYVGYRMNVSSILSKK